ncbi:MAG: hypothetical protein KVP17_004110 [Porospora cf. gigantea B]|uniref:uncharacterized protein n=1 Tax=Porospora cf. gigantea B TaxID=2853592 RepID=UPI003571806F|nr:MAG: hypothetical protein KVP17_004110 [Porospora cf. gigantea B]
MANPHYRACQPPQNGPWAPYLVPPRTLQLAQSHTKLGFAQSSVASASHGHWRRLYSGGRRRGESRRNLAYTPNWVSDAIKDSLIPTVEERKTGLLTQIHNTAASNVTASINEYVVLEELLKRLTAEANCIAKFDRDVIDEEDEDAEDKRFSMVPDEEYRLLYDTQVALLRLENATNRELSGAFEVSNCEWPENLKLFDDVMTTQTQRPSLWLDPQPPLLDLTSLLVATVGADAYQDAEGLSASAVAFNSEDVEDAEDIVEDDVDEDKDAPRAETDVKLDEFENKCAPFERVVWALSHRLIRQGALADQATYIGKGEMDKYEANEWIDDTDGVIAVFNDSDSEEDSDMEVQYEDAELFVCDDNEENDEDDDYEEPVLHAASVTEDDISSGTKGFVDPKGWRLFREHLKARPNLEVLCLRLERELTEFLDSLRPEYPLLLAAMDYQVDLGRQTVCPLNHTPGEPPCGVVVLPPATSNGTVIANDVTAVSRRLYELFSARIREYIRETDAVVLPERLTFADAVELDAELNRLPEELDTYLPLLVEVVVSHTTSLVPPGTGRGAVLTVRTGGLTNAGIILRVHSCLCAT